MLLLLPDYTHVGSATASFKDLVTLHRRENATNQRPEPRAWTRTGRGPEPQAWTRTPGVGHSFAYYSHKPKTRTPGVDQNPGRGSFVCLLQPQTKDQKPGCGSFHLLITAHAMGHMKRHRAWVIRSAYYSPRHGPYETPLGVGHSFCLLQPAPWAI